MAFPVNPGSRVAFLCTQSLPVSSPPIRACFRKTLFQASYHSRMLVNTLCTTFGIFPCPLFVPLRCRSLILYQACILYVTLASKIPSVSERTERDPLTLGRIALHCRPGRDRGAKASLPSRRRDKRPRCWGSPARYKPKPPAYPPADDCRATDAGVAQLAGRQSFPGTRRRRHRRSPELLRDLRYGALACIAYSCGSVRVAQRVAHTHVWRI